MKYLADFAAHSATNASMLRIKQFTYGDVAFKSSYLYELYHVYTKMAVLSWRRIPLAILLYGQFIHLTQIALRPNIQLFLVTSWFYSIYNIVAYWVKFR